MLINVFRLLSCHSLHTTSYYSIILFQILAYAGILSILGVKGACNTLVDVLYWHMVNANVASQYREHLRPYFKGPGG